MVLFIYSGVIFKIDLFAADDEGGSSWPMPGQGQGSPNSGSSSFSNGSGVEMNLFDLLSDVDLVATGAGGSMLSDGGVAPLWLQPSLAADASAVWNSWSPSEAVVVPSAADRAERVRRYREKRKNRKFQKTIRYATRKAYAEARPRIDLEQRLECALGKIRETNVYIHTTACAKFTSAHMLLSVFE